MGLLRFVVALLFDETLPSGERYEGTVLGSVKQLGAVARNKGFSAFLGIVGLYNLPFMAYIAVGSYVYITFFGLTELEYSMYFAFAALLTAAGPFIWLAASRFMSARRFTSILLGIALALLQAVLLLGLAFKATDYFDPELIARSTREESKCYAPVMCVADKIFPSLGEYAREYLPRPEREEPAEKPETTEKLQNA